MIQLVNYWGCRVPCIMPHLLVSDAQRGGQTPRSSRLSKLMEQDDAGDMGKRVEIVSDDPLTNKVGNMI